MTRNTRRLWSFFGLLTMAWSPVSAQDRAGHDRLLTGVPPEATTAILIDLRAGTESAKAWSGLQTPEQAAVVHATALLCLQQALAGVAPGLTVETDVLPWLTRRAVLSVIGRETVLMIETEGGTSSAAAFERLVQQGVQQGAMGPGPAIEGVPTWQGLPRKATRLARVGTAIVVGDPGPAFTAVVRRLRAGAPEAAPVVAAIEGTPPGAIRVAHRLPAPVKDARGPRAIGGISASLRLAADALVGEARLALSPEARAGLAALKPTFGESVACIPESAAAVVAAARPGPVLQALGFPLAESLPWMLFGQEGMRPLVEALAPIVSDLLNQEVALGWIPAPGGPSWLAVFTTARPGDLMQRVLQFIQAGRGVTGVTWSSAPVGALPAWSLALAHPQGGRTRTLHFAVLDARLLVAGDRSALEAGIATLRGTTRPVATAPWCVQAGSALAPDAMWKACANLRGLGRVLGGVIAQHAGVSVPHAGQIAEAALAGFGNGTLSAGFGGDSVHILARADVDPAKMAAVGITIPAAAGLAAALPAIARARVQARRNTCYSNMKQLGLAALMFAQDHDEQLPPAEEWAKALEPYIKNGAVLRCSADPGEHACSYAFNKALSQLPLAQVDRPAETVMFYETTSAHPSPSGTGEEMPQPPRHDGGSVYTYVDGHVKWVPGDPPREWFDPTRK